MPNEIKAKQSVAAALTITVAGLGTGAGRISTQVDNKVALHQKIYLYAKITSGATPPATGALYKFYLIRSDNHATQYVSEGLGLVDAAVAGEPLNAELVMTIVTGALANTGYFADTTFLNPGPEWSILCFNSSGQTINGTPANSFVHWVGENPDVQ